MTHIYLYLSGFFLLRPFFSYTKYAQQRKKKVFTFSLEFVLWALFDSIHILLTYFVRWKIWKRNFFPITLMREKFHSGNSELLDPLHSHLISCIHNIFIHRKYNRYWYFPWENSLISNKMTQHNCEPVRMMHDVRENQWLLFILLILKWFT
jgi:hypothetical protein